MVEISAILGAVSASLGLLNLARQGINSIVNDVREYQNYGKTLAKLILDIESTYQLLGLWESEWEIGNSEDGEEGVKCFGPAGWEMVRQQMALIAGTSLNLVGLLALLLPSGKTFPAARPTIYDIRSIFVCVNFQKAAKTGRSTTRY